ncbi:hypothetical protein ATANTOWER_003760, partial [Ataeniobius toweri]|nr:hypothetical protein [Ataeniobius toweri]
YVTVHVGIHGSLNELQLPTDGSTHAAPNHDTPTTILDCRLDILVFVLLTRSQPLWSTMARPALNDEPVLLNCCMVFATVQQLNFRVLAVFLWPRPSLCRTTNV